MSGHTYIHTYTQDNYSNPRCARVPRVNNYPSVEFCDVQIPTAHRMQYYVIIIIIIIIIIMISV